MRIDNEKKIVLRINRDTSISLNNQIILADSSSNDISVRLPNLLSQLNQLTSQGYFFEVKKISSSNSVFIIPPSGQLIDNQALITLSNLNEGVYLKFDGNNYQIVSSIIYGSSGSSSYITSVSDTSTVNLSVVDSNLRADFTSMNISQFTNDSGYLTASGLSGYVPTSRTISINGTSYDLSSNRSWSVGTITSIALSGGTGISISGSPITTSGNITITNTAPDQTVVLNSGTGISITGTYPTFTITNSSPSSGGTVTSVSGTSNRITSSGGNAPVIDISASYVGQTSITTLGTITTGTWNASTIDVSKGGTGLTAVGNAYQFISTNSAANRLQYVDGVICLGKNTTVPAATVSGTNSETLCAVIPLGTPSTGMLDFFAMARCTVFSSGGLTLRLRIGSLASPSNAQAAAATLLAQTTISSTTTFYAPMQRHFTIKSGASGSIIGTATTAAFTDTTGNNTYTANRIDFSTNQYLYITIVPAAVGNTLELISYYCNKM